MLQQLIQPAEVEAVGEAEQQEAWHKHLSAETDGQRQVDLYRKRYLQWLKQPMAAHTAYIQRACMHLQAKCYLQVRQPMQCCCHQIALPHFQSMCILGPYACSCLSCNKRLCNARLVCGWQGAFYVPCASCLSDIQVPSGAALLIAA